MQVSYTWKLEVSSDRVIFVIIFKEWVMDGWVRDEVEGSTARIVQMTRVEVHRAIDLFCDPACHWFAYLHIQQ